jgi:hypothetical protein
MSVFSIQETLAARDAAKAFHRARKRTMEAAECRFKKRYFPCMALSIAKLRGVTITEEEPFPDGAMLILNQLEEATGLNVLKATPLQWVEALDDLTEMDGVSVSLETTSPAEGADA